MKKMMENSGSVLSMLKQFPQMVKLISDNTNHTLNHPKMKKLMAEESFDLVMIGLFMNDFLLGIADHFKCPSLVITSMGTTGKVQHLIGNPLSVSGVPHMFMEHKGGMSFIQRVKNMLMYTAEFGMGMYFNSFNKKYYE